jgi:hypothetical protein
MEPVVKIQSPWWGFTADIPCGGKDSTKAGKQKRFLRQIIAVKSNCENYQ